MSESRQLTISRPEMLRDGSDVQFRRFLHCFMTFARSLGGIRGCLAREIGVTEPQYEILSHLRENAARGGLTVAEVTARLQCSGTFVAAQTGKLERAGLVLRQRDPEDARRVRLTLSGAGERCFRKLATLQRLLNNVMFGSLTTRQFRVLDETFQTLVDDGARAVALAQLLGSTGRASATRDAS